MTIVSKQLDATSVLYDMRNHRAIVGRTVVAVRGDKLYLDNGTAFQLELDADCCSCSEYTPEGLSAIAELAGCRIQAIEDRDGESAPGISERWPGEQESDKWHFLVVTTDKGHVTIDWRNSSNGYYDGSCSVVEVPVHHVLRDALLDGASADVVGRLLDAERKP